MGTIYISRNLEQVIFYRNTFKRNVGTFGGAITINSPNFEHGIEPYTVFKDNTFINNMAYFAGGAVYIRLTKWESRLEEICAGFSIEGDVYSENMGLKTSSGGALSIVCDYLTDYSLEDYGMTSSYTSLWLLIDELLTIPSSISGVVSPATQFDAYAYRGLIRDSEFSQNYAGTKGSAIHLKYISQIAIEGCLIQGNGPVNVLKELTVSPYAYYLAERSITYFDESYTCWDEYEWIHDCAVENTYIVWSEVHGAVYIEMCEE